MSTITDGTTTIAPELVLGYETSQAGRNTFHDILDRAEPDVSIAPAGLRSGSLTLFFLTADDAEACRQMHSRPAVFTYTPDDNPTTAMSYVLDDGGVRTALDDQTRRRWTVTVSYREVAP